MPSATWSADPHSHRFIGGPRVENSQFEVSPGAGGGRCAGGRSGYSTFRGPGTGTARRGERVSGEPSRQGTGTGAEHAGDGEGFMGLRGGERRILRLIENDLRASDPQLFLAFTAFGSNTGKARMPWQERRSRLRAIFSPALAGRGDGTHHSDSASHGAVSSRAGRPWGLVLLIPLVLLAVISLLVVTGPVSRSPRCSFIPAVPAAGATRIIRCPPANRAPQNPAGSGQPAGSAQNAAAVRASLATWAAALPGKLSWCRLGRARHAQGQHRDVVPGGPAT
jgi:hypothetical protein